MADFFIADTHFCDEDIIGYSKRPFKTVTEMNHVMIERWNAKVTNNSDRVFIVGDFARAKDPADVLKILKKLNGRKIMVLGNHDMPYIKYQQVKNQFENVKSYYFYKESGLILVLFHYPVFEWEMMRNGSIMLHGHVHNNKCEYVDDIKNMLNISADNTDFTPLAVEDVIRKVGEKNCKIQKEKLMNKNG